MAALSLLLLAALAGNPNPHNLLELECKIKHAAYAWAMEKDLPQPSIALDLARALSTPECKLAPTNNSTYGSTPGLPHATDPHHHHARAEVTVYVSSTEGSDAEGDGSKAHPFATLRRAAAFTRTARATADAEPAALPALVCISPGTYVLHRTLSLGPDDSHTTWSGACTGAASGAVVLTGAETLSPLSWKPSGDARMPGVFVAELEGAQLPTEASFSQLFADGKRQIRARWPNGDPEGVSGLCFTKGQ